MGGNVFAGKTAKIHLEHIAPTLNTYFSELKNLFPHKADIFNDQHFIPLGSVGKKSVSGDIDLGVSSLDILDLTMSDAAIAAWNIDPQAVAAECKLLTSRARTATAEHLRMKAFLKTLTLYINANAPNLYCDEKKVSNGNVFGCFPQIDQNNRKLDTGVQIDWMIGNLEWLKFSYYSTPYSEESNVKGLHRTQLLLAAFQIANLSFNHIDGVKDKSSNKIVATNQLQALALLSSQLGVQITESDSENYYSLLSVLKQGMSASDYGALLNVYFKILDSTRADIPENIQDEWHKRRDNLGLTGKFLPETSLLKVLL